MAAFIKGLFILFVIVPISMGLVLFVLMLVGGLASVLVPIFFVLGIPYAVGKLFS